jgi:hypothetical protein
MVDERPWHALTVEEVFEELNSSDSGLVEAEAARRLEKYGPNEIETEEGTSKLALLLHQYATLWLQSSSLPRSWRLPPGNDRYDCHCCGHRSEHRDWIYSGIPGR